MLDFIEPLFIMFLNMGITGSYIILATILIRLILKKAPKIFSYCLWAVAGLRLICPFSFSSVISVFNLISPRLIKAGNGTFTSYVPQDIGAMAVPEISTGIPAADAVINPALPVAEIGESVNPIQIITAVASSVWAIGIIAMAIYGVISIVKVYKRIEFAIKYDGNIFECDRVRSPFVFGIFKPKIYLPCGMDARQREYVILHEKNHIRRLDHITKLVSFAILMLHWYNPLVWLGYTLMVRDMEMSCDEKVLKGFTEEEKKSYGLTLVAIGANRRFAAAAPLSFGENVVEKRIVNVLKFRKPRAIAVILCVIVCVAVAAVCLTNADNDGYGSGTQLKIEKFIEDDWNKRVAGNDYYEYETAIAGVNIVQIDGENNIVYGWQRLYHFNIDYQSILNYKNLLKEHDSGTAFPFKAELDNKGNVISVESIEGDIPEFLGSEGLCDLSVFRRVKDKAEKEYEKLSRSIKSYKIENLSIAYSAAINIFEGFEVTDGEIVVDQLNKPILVLKIKNTARNGKYLVDDAFSLTLNGKEIEVKHPAKGDLTVLPEGVNGHVEVLWFGDLSMFVDDITEGEYQVTMSAVNAEYKDRVFEPFVSFRVNDLRQKRPTLSLDKLAPESNEPINAKISGVDYGTINYYQNGYTVIPLSKNEIKDIVKSFNKLKFIEDYEAGDAKWSDSVYVSLWGDNGKRYEFTVFSNGWVLDSRGNHNYCENTQEIHGLLCEILTKHGAVIEETKYNSDVPHTELASVVGTTSKNRFPSFATIKAAGNNNTSYTKAVIKNQKLNSPDELGLELIGIKVENRQFIATFANKNTDEYIIISTDYEMDKRSGNEWQSAVVKTEYESYGSEFVLPNSFAMFGFPVYKFYSGIENGHYRMSFPASKATGVELAEIKASYNISIEFDVEVREVTYAQNYAERMGAPVSMKVTAPTTGTEFFKTCFTDKEMREAAKIYNEISWKPGDNYINENNYYIVEIITGNNLYYIFAVGEDGVYDMSSDDLTLVLVTANEMYRYISSIW